jgi:hypothetical protein
MQAAFPGSSWNFDFEKWPNFRRQNARPRPIRPCVAGDNREVCRMFVRFGAAICGAMIFIGCSFAAMAEAGIASVYVSLPKTRFERIDGIIRQGLDMRLCPRTARSGACREHPSPARREFAPRCSS